jgi:acyl dehydratase
MSDGPKTSYFEDYEIGQEWESTGRTITETDNMSWVYLTGEWHPLHVDEEYARAHTPFHTRMPPGMMVAAIAIGIAGPLKITGGRGAVAFMEQTARYKRPVRIGDTIHVKITVAEKTPASNPKRGLLRLNALVINQDGTVCQDNDWVFLLARRQDGDKGQADATS